MGFLQAVYFKLGLSYLSITNDKKAETRITSSNSKSGIFASAILGGLALIIYYFLSFSGRTIYSNVNGVETSDVTPKELLSCLIIFLLITAFVIVYIAIKRHIIFKKKEAQPYNANLYSRELPSNLTPAHARMLVDDGTVDKKTLAATIMDLIDRGYLKLESDNRIDIFSKNLNLSVTDKSQDDLFEYEKYIIKWFFEDGSSITSTKLRERLNNAEYDPCEKFAIFYGLVLVSFPLKKYYRKFTNNIKKIIYVICLLMLFIGPVFSRGIITSSILYFVSLFGITNLFLASPTYLLNSEGAELKDNYLDLKRFLVDFSRIEERTSKMIVIWNYYLSYSVALGIEGIAGNEIESFFGNAIYNRNTTDEEDIRVKYYESNQKLIKLIPEYIKESEDIYKKR